MFRLAEVACEVGDSLCSGEHLRGATVQHDDRDQVVVPGPEELEDREGGDRRHRQRQDQPHEGTEVIGAVDSGGLDEFARQARHVVVQQEDRERHRETGVGQDDRPWPTRQCEVRHHRQGPLGERDGEVGTAAVHDQQGDQGHLQRDRQQRDRADEQRLAALEVDPGEGVGRERSDRNRDDRRGHGDGERGDHRAEHAARLIVAEDHAIVLDHVEQVGSVVVLGAAEPVVAVAVAHELPEARVALAGPAPERVDEQRHGRDGPDDDDAPHDPHGDIAEPAVDAVDERVVVVHHASAFCML